jgi:hypothetical protein
MRVEKKKKEVTAPKLAVGLVIPKRKDSLAVFKRLSFFLTYFFANLTSRPKDYKF